MTSPSNRRRRRTSRRDPTLALAQRFPYRDQPRAHHTPPTLMQTPSRPSRGNHALLAKLPDGTCLSPALSLSRGSRAQPRVLTVELVEFDGGPFEVGEEPEVTPVGQLQLLGVGQACAAHDQASCHSFLADASRVCAFGDFGLPVVAALDLGPRIIRGLGDGVVDAVAGTSHGHRVTHIEPANTVIVSPDQNPESNRIVNPPVVPARRIGRRARR